MPKRVDPPLGLTTEQAFVEGEDDRLVPAKLAKLRASRVKREISFARKNRAQRSPNCIGAGPGGEPRQFGGNFFDGSSAAID